MSLENKAAIVTGGDSGIGHAISLELGRQGAAVTVNYHKDEAAAKATVDAITSAGGKARPSWRCVVADLQTVDATVKSFGRLT
jgi:3-oxoacyl-[acyl-carrier protein] reductase